MDPLNEFPKIMAHAHTDLAGNVAGQFSPTDWASILTEARTRLDAGQARGLNENEAWAQVMREFYSERQWGFRADYKAPKKVKPENPNLGVSFIWMTFTAFIVTKIAVVWTGQTYTRSDDPKDKWIFFAALSAAILNWVIFLWRARKHKD